MRVDTSLEVVVQESSQVGQARRSIAELGTRCGFDEVASGNLAIVVSELASNLAKHARDGLLIARVVKQAEAPVIEILAVDRGPGIANVDRCLTDGFSTSGTPGTGLGAIRRLSVSWDIFSMPGSGTVQVARVAARRAADSAPALISAISVPAPGETECGDAWAWMQDGALIRLLVADGLGHGPAAAEAATEAVRMFISQPGGAPAEMIRGAHAALRSTRGAAIAIVEIDRIKRSLRFAGVGNISAQIVSPQKRQNLVSLNGTVGAQLPTPREFVYELPPNSIVCCWSDGLTSRTGFDNYPGLIQRDPAVIAGVLYRDFKRGRDDATVVVCTT